MHLSSAIAGEGGFTIGAGASVLRISAIPTLLDMYSRRFVKISMAPKYPEKPVVVF